MLIRIFSIFLFQAFILQTAVAKIIVSKDGTGDFMSIQAAIYSLGNEREGPDTIHIQNGIYNEKVLIPESIPNLVIIGEDRDQTIINSADFSGKPRHTPDDDGNPNFRTFSSYTLRVQADNISIANMTILNSAGEVGQAVSLQIHGDQVQIRNCTISAHQDTLYLSKANARSFFQNCTINGTTDFIFGAGTAYFENCDIICGKNSYITAAATPQEESYGLVFRNCNILPKNDEIDSVYLGRPWRPYAKTVFIHCHLGPHIRPEGWHNWSNPDKEKTCFYAELNCTGPGSKNINQRVPWSHQIDDIQLEQYSTSKVLKGWTP